MCMEGVHPARDLLKYCGELSGLPPCTTWYAASMPAHTSKRAAYVLITACLTCATSVSVYAQTTRILFYPTPDGAGYTSFHAISGDGTTAVGRLGINAIRWTETTGITNMPMMTGWRSAFASGASRDGRVISVTGESAMGSQAYRWNGTDYESLRGVLGPVGGYALGMSADGQTVVGALWSLGNQSNLRPARWGPNNIGSNVSAEYGYAFAANNNASIIVGHRGSHSESFRWTAATGDLNLPSRQVRGISADGNVLVGALGANPAIWRDNLAPIVLPVTPLCCGGPATGVATACNADGSVVTGTLPQGSFLWTERSGPVLLSEILRSRSIDPTLRLSYVYGISDDGTRFAAAGYRYDPVNNSPSGLMIIDLPICPGDFNRDYFVDLFDYLDFVSAFAAADPAADLNSDGVVDFFDYLDFVDRFRGTR